MARDYHPPFNEMKFAMHESVECDRDTIDMVVESTAQLCVDELAPINMSADREGCTWVNESTVTTPAGFKKAYDLYRESGFQGLSFPVEYGGQGLPNSLALIQAEMVAAANWTWLMFPGLSKGAINTILSHGSPELKDKYLPKLISGEFTGTMCLTEPGCGSDLGQVITKAERLADGSYLISGTKIFISCGDHDLTSNIVHCVLARLKDAPPAAASPEGTRGISLFLVPKFLEDGSPNGVKTSRIENKMGCHGSPTCQLEFENAKGWLLGTENKGMGHMFTFINTSRVGTAVQGVAAAENALQNSLWYCKDRMSMRALSGTKEPGRIADPIIHHPSVRHLLLIMKAYSEGGRSMVYECAQLTDTMLEAEANAKAAKVAGDSARAAKHMAAAKQIDERLGFLTPILKGFLTEAGKEAADHGIQVYGGHGYIKDNKAEQVYRDVRIAPVWEGTTQIQALDLLGRKILRGKLAPMHLHCAELRAQCLPLLLSPHSSVRTHARDLLSHAIEWQYLTYRIAGRAMRDKEAVGVAAVDYLAFSGYVTLASHWLKMEQVALEQLAKPASVDGGKDGNRILEPEFYKAKIQTAEFVFSALLPRTRSLARGMLTPVSAVTAMDKDHFSFDHAR
jgi:alkylation response protein AidB-like acyl-CoA dehydrogenase